MAKKTENKESVIKKVAHAAEHVVEEVGEAIEHVVETVAEGVEKTVESLIEDNSEKDENKVTKKKKTESIKKEKGEEKPKTKKKELSEALKAKLKALEGKFEGIEKITGEKSEPTNTLVPIEDYLKASMHLGTRVITPNMRKYIYKRRADGLAVFNTAMLDTKMREA